MQDVAIETPITSMEGETTSTSQVEGAWIYIPPTNNIKGPNKSTNNPSRTFQQVSLQEGWNSTQKQALDKKWAFFFMKRTSRPMLRNTQHS